MIQINPVVFPILGTATQLKVVVYSFDTLETTCSLEYTLLTEDGSVCTRGIYVLTEEEFQTWAADNDYLNHLIADKIGVIIVS